MKPERLEHWRLFTEIDADLIPYLKRESVLIDLARDLADAAGPEVRDLAYQILGMLG